MNARHVRAAKLLLAGVSGAVLSGCLATTPSSGGGSATAVTGAAGGATAAGENSSLEKCGETLGTLRIEENTGAPWYGYYASNYQLGSTVPVLRTMIQQSNCFVIVERGRTMNTMNAERALIRGEEGRAGSNFGGGQIAAADYTLSPEIMMSNRGTEGATLSGLTSRLGGLLGVAAGAAAGSMSSNEAGTILLLIDNRSSVQIASSEGYSKNTDFGFVGGLFGGGSALGGSAYAKTPQGKVVVAAFVDSYNKMVVALRNYKAQTVKGGLGTGGRLGVQGGQTDAAREISQPKPATKK